MSLYTLEERRVLANHYNELAAKFKAMGIVVKDPYDPENPAANFRESVGLLFWNVTDFFHFLPQNAANEKRREELVAMVNELEKVGWKPEELSLRVRYG